MSWSVTWAQFWSSLFLQTNMEGGYWCRNMLRDFTVQPATGGSPAGKAYTHQFPEHVSFYLCILIERVFYVFAVKLSSAGSWVDMDLMVITSVRCPESDVQCDSQTYAYVYTYTHTHTQQTSTESRALVQNREAVRTGERTHNTEAHTIHSGIYVFPTR